MKKKLLFVLLLVLAFTVNVNAANKVVKEGESDFNSFKTEYQKGIQKVNINSTGTVTLYGYSSCRTGSCVYKYANTSQDFKEVLQKAVVCTGGEKYIVYQSTGGADGYKTSNSENFVGEVYWSEDFSVTCTNTSSGNTVTLNNINQEQTTVSNSGSNSNNNNNNNNDEYNSSNTTNNENQGVETYYIILGIVGVVTYLLSIVIKKQNLFKKVWFSIKNDISYL